MALPNAASVLSSGLGQYPTVYYDRVALDTLRSSLYFYPACELKQMPDKNGVAMQIFDYTAFGSNTTAATEGTPGSGQALTQTPGTINLSQFVDYVSFSDKVVLTGISDTVAEGARELAYRGAISVDTVVQTAVDSAAGADATSKIALANGVYMSGSTSRKAAMLLRSVNIKPKANGQYFGIIPSVLAFDLVNDATAGGFIDLMKYTESNAAKLQEGIVANRVGTVGGVEWFESNNISSEADYQAAGVTGYHAYVFGYQAFIASSLGKTQLGQKNFTVKTSKFDQPIALDPANTIAAASAYNFFFGLVKRPGSVSGFRRITAQSSIG